MVLFGAFHGLIFLPVTLSLFGPGERPDSAPGFVEWLFPEAAANFSSNNIPSKQGNRRKVSEINEISRPTGEHDPLLPRKAHAIKRLPSSLA